MAGTSKPKSQQRKTPQGKGRPAPQRNAERAAARKQVAAVIIFPLLNLYSRRRYLGRLARLLIRAFRLLLVCHSAFANLCRGNGNA